MEGHDEYRILRRTDILDLEEDMNRLGREGWTLTDYSVLGTPDCEHYVIMTKWIECKPIESA